MNIIRGTKSLADYQSTPLLFNLVFKSLGKSSETMQEHSHEGMIIKDRLLPYEHAQHTKTPHHPSFPSLKISQVVTGQKKCWGGGKGKKMIFFKSLIGFQKGIAYIGIYFLFIVAVPRSVKRGKVTW